MMIYATFDADGNAVSFDHREDYEGSPGGVLISPSDWEKLALDPAHHRWIGGKVVEVQPASTYDGPEGISRRQFFQMLANMGEISEDEAELAMEGKIPQALLAMVNTFPEEIRFSARMLLRGATDFSRGHSLVGVIRDAKGWDQRKLDAFWAEAGKL